MGPGGLKVRAPGPNLSKGPQLICDATAVDQSSTTNQLSTVNQTPSVSHSSKVASSANPTLPTSVVFKQLTQPLLITDLQAGKIISHTLKGFVRSITGTQLRIWPRI